MLRLMMLIGAVGGLVAAVAAWLITYNEYTKHYPTDRRPARRAAAEAAAVAYFFFFALGLTIGWVLGRMFPIPY